ncbi:cell envelope-related transcriptional attenuator [Xylanimonas cellulosilytica DSM 15894]|uniref:Cell envelope-related transcriptional attenuator n=1 Tax=Xylanimonas cellulosilytica (strain DSM 15894 / JCM 12276 / CECT 5975 / KCTC 9989 / LMG 20990 / NBRC 107835 / XIL07) TaxID=446471 RepID=D1BYY1_XYLCX|nr:LCP family protein [Xylanimonas cellulosilytica]ACZ30056.1 cell envelope-related transcriptional attenuator [Xylanimonas cellulosilytica DSM 15894]
MATSLPRHAARLRAHRVARVVGLVATGALAFTVGGVAAAYVDLQSNIQVSDVDDLLGTDRPAPPADPDDPNAGRAMNILVMGTDFRGEGNEAIAGAGDEFHSDSTLLIHVSGDRRWVEVVSIPRDSLVDIPACPLPGGGESRPRSNAMFNVAFAIGGGPDKDVTGAAACTIRTVETLTGVGITDHVVAKMTGVIDVVDAIGGVRMCFPEPVVGDRHVDLDLPAGPHTLTGYEAINFLRARGGQGLGLELGSDLARIQRQQAFVSSTMRDVLAQNVITDAPRLYRVAESVLQAISTSPGLASTRALAGLAWSLRTVDSDNIVFTPLAVVDVPDSGGRVAWVTSETDALWARIAAGDPPPSVAARVGTDDDGAQTTSPPTSDAPDDTGTGTGTGDDPGGDAGGDPDDAPTAPETETPGPDAPEPTPTPSLLPGVCP